MSWQALEWVSVEACKGAKVQQDESSLLEEFYRRYIDPPRRQASHNSKWQFQIMTNVPSLRFQIVSQVVSRPCTPQACSTCWLSRLTDSTDIYMGRAVFRLMSSSTGRQPFKLTQGVIYLLSWILASALRTQAPCDLMKTPLPLDTPWWSRIEGSSNGSTSRFVHTFNRDICIQNVLQPVHRVECFLPDQHRDPRTLETTRCQLKEIGTGSEYPEFQGRRFLHFLNVALHVITSSEQWYG